MRIRNKEVFHLCVCVCVEIVDMASGKANIGQDDGQISS